MLPIARTSGGTRRAVGRFFQQQKLMSPSLSSEHRGETFFCQTVPASGRIGAPTMALSQVSRMWWEEFTSMLVLGLGTSRI